MTVNDPVLNSTSKKGRVGRTWTDVGRVLWNEPAFWSLDWKNKCRKEPSSASLCRAMNGQWMTSWLCRGGPAVNGCCFPTRVIGPNNTNNLYFLDTTCQHCRTRTGMPVSEGLSCLPPYGAMSCVSRVDDRPPNAIAAATPTGKHYTRDVRCVMFLSPDRDGRRSYQQRPGLGPETPSSGVRTTFVPSEQEMMTPRRSG